MTIPSEIRAKVRIRANFACEYCGTSELNCGGELTIDHFRPSASEGTDELENLVYCCFRCNINKGDYWPILETDTRLWNPREEPASQHFLLLADGLLHPITPTGVATIRHLRLNRSWLIASRRQRLCKTEAARLLETMESRLADLGAMRREYDALVSGHHTLLQLQRAAIERLLRNRS